MLDSPSCRKSSKAEHCRRMLYVLQRDLLASPIAGMILEKKSLRDRFYRDSTLFPAYNFHLTGPAVGPAIKLLILLFLCGAVTVMLGYVIVFSIEFPSQLQRAWSYAMFTWVGFDLLFISTLEVLLLHVLLPLTIKADLAVVLDLLTGVVAKYTEKVKKDNQVRTATTDPVVVHRGKSIMGLLPDEVPEEVVVHNISDLFFVTTRIAEHDHDTAEARFLHAYNTMLPPGALFANNSNNTSAAWYRQLDESLKANTKKFKTQSTLVARELQESVTTTTAAAAGVGGGVATATTGGGGGDDGVVATTTSTAAPRQSGYRTIFRLDILYSALLQLLVLFIYCPVWVQDFIMHQTLVIAVGGLLLVMYAMYQVETALVALPIILLALLFLILYFINAIIRLLKWFNTVSNRVRPISSLPSHKYQINELTKNTSSRSGRSGRNDRPNSSVDVEAAVVPMAVTMKPSLLQPFPLGPGGAVGAISSGGGVAYPLKTKPLAVDGKPPYDATSPDRYPKNMPTQSSPFPRQGAEFFPASGSISAEEGSESEADVPSEQKIRPDVPEPATAAQEAEDTAAASPRSAKSAKLRSNSSAKSPISAKMHRQQSNRSSGGSSKRAAPGPMNLFGDGSDVGPAADGFEEEEKSPHGAHIDAHPFGIAYDAGEAGNERESENNDENNANDQDPTEPMPDAADASRNFSESEHGGSQQASQGSQASQQADDEADADGSDKSSNSNGGQQFPGQVTPVVRRAQSHKETSSRKTGNPVGAKFLSPASLVAAAVGGKGQDESATLRMQNLVLPDKPGVIPAAPTVTSKNASPAAVSPPKPVTVLPVSFVAQSVEDEQDDSDFEDSSSQFTDETMDEPIDHSM